MLSAVFFEKAIWAFFALVGSLIAVIYKLFNGNLQKDLKMQKEEIKNEIEIKFGFKIGSLEKEVEKLREEIFSFKRHENNNFNYQKTLLNKVLHKLDNYDPKIFSEAVDE